MENKIQELEERIFAIEKRNKRVEMDKAWETSDQRKAVIFGLTYVVVVLLLVAGKIDRPFANAVIPSIAFVLSTQTLSFFKKNWLKRK